MRQSILILLFAVVVTTSVDARQVAGDTVVVRLDEIVVEAERHSQRLADATSAISTLDLESGMGYAVAAPTQLLSMLPGLGFVSLDGTGHDAQAVVRGFFGGGDAEYVQVLLDGVPINDMESGLVPWDLIDPRDLSHVEILRGGSSPLYGDAAIGGVVHLHSSIPARRMLRGSLRYGSGDAVDASARYADRIGSRTLSVGGLLDRSDGYRERGRREVAAVNASGDLLSGGSVTGRLSLSSSWRDVQKPGPLTDSLFAVSRTAVSPMFAFDRVDERRHSADLSFASVGDRSLSWSLRAGGSLREARDISTLPLAAEFADTQDRDLSTNSIGLSGQTALQGRSGKVVVGTDIARDGVESTYYRYFTGGPADYEAAGPVSRGDLLNSGAGSRTALGGYVHAESRRLGPVLFAGGVRGDVIVDRYQPDGGDEVETTHRALSPRASTNVELVSTDRQQVNIYATVSGSFKAPAVDQLFDQRATPVPFPPFEVAISNGELKPQRGVNREVGLYGQSVVPGRGRVEASLAAYRMDMRDELDFSFEEFRLINIGRSRHDGVETGLKYFDRSGVSAFANYALQSTTFRNGDNEGNYVKAVPRDLINAGFSYTHRSGVAAGLRYSGARRIFLDDQNARRLDDKDRFDVQVSARVAGARITVEVFNVFDREGVSTGFPDPGGGDARFLYPTAERTVKLGVEYRVGRD
jgi:outer membrane receptor protein involved in Fe transport